MNAEQLSIALSEAAMLTGENVFIVDGPPAILAQFPDAPAHLLGGRGLSLCPLLSNAPCFLINTHMFLGSSFDERHGIFLTSRCVHDIVLPKGWDKRAGNMISSEPGKGVLGICPEIHDLAVSLLEKPWEERLTWIIDARDAGLLDPETLIDRIGKTKHRSFTARKEMLHWCSQTLSVSEAPSP